MSKERRGLEAATKAVDAFVAHMGYEDGEMEPEQILTDLIADILHLADGRLISGYWVWEKAGEHYGVEESDDEDDFELRGPESIDADVEEFVLIDGEYVSTADLGQVEPDPEVGGAPLPAGLHEDHDALRSGADERPDIYGL